MTENPTLIVQPSTERFRFSFTDFGLVLVRKGTRIFGIYVSILFVNKIFICYF